MRCIWNRTLLLDRAHLLRLSPHIYPTLATTLFRGNFLRLGLLTVLPPHNHCINTLSRIILLTFQQWRMRNDRIFTVNTPTMAIASNHFFPSFVEFLLLFSDTFLFLMQKMCSAHALTHKLHAWTRSLALFSFSPSLFMWNKVNAS